jgi:large subunit ribosomal protein L22
MAQAKSRQVGISTVNIRRVAALVRGKQVDSAVSTLKFVPSTAAVVVRKLIESAAANAQNNDLKARDNLKVINVTADKGPRLRRFRPKARGRAGRFDRPASHITVVVDEAPASAEGSE